MPSVRLDSLQTGNGLRGKTMPILRFAEGLGMSQPCFPHGRLVTSGLKNGDFVKNGDLMTARVISETRCEHRADNRPCYSHVPFYGL